MFRFLKALFFDEAPRRPPLWMLPERFVVLDLETTGLHADRHEIIEIAAIRVNRDSDEHDTLSTLITPSKKLPAKIRELTGLTDEQLRTDGIPLSQALDDLCAFVGDLPLVSFNWDFDGEFLRFACRAVGRNALRNRSSCALKMARDAWPYRKSYRLSQICQDAGIAIHGEHRALPDCERALRVYVAAAQKLRRS